jgi:hypothetical protein
MSEGGRRFFGLSARFGHHPYGITTVERIHLHICPLSARLCLSPYSTATDRRPRRDLENAPVLVDPSGAPFPSDLFPLLTGRPGYYRTVLTSTSNPYYPILRSVLLVDMPLHTCLKSHPILGTISR